MDIDGIKEIIAKDENRVLELKKTTGELIKGMQSLCAFLNKEEAEKFAKEYENEHVYNPYADLYCGTMVIEELPTKFDAEEAWWKE